MFTSSSDCGCACVSYCLLVRLHDRMDLFHLLFEIFLYSTFHFMYLKFDFVVSTQKDCMAANSSHAQLSSSILSIPIPMVASTDGSSMISMPLNPQLTACDAFCITFPWHIFVTPSSPSITARTMTLQHLQSLHDNEPTNLRAMVAIGFVYHHGLFGTPKNTNLALRWYRRAGYAGSEYGCFNTGCMLRDGNSTNIISYGQRAITSNVLLIKYKN
jgi:hypothetical protein